MMEKKIKITNLNQFETLVRELEKNANLAKGFSRGAQPTNFRKKWRNITMKLNALGPPIRDSDGWQKVWRDLKFKTKKKVTQYKAECNATGGGRFKKTVLSPLEKAVENLMQFEKQLTPEDAVYGPTESMAVEEDETESVLPPNLLCGDGLENQVDVAEIGPKCLFLEETDLSDVFVPVVQTSSPFHIHPNTSSDVKNASKTKVNSNMEEKLLTEISQSITLVKNILKDSKKIEEQKLKLLKRKNEREEELYKYDIQIKRIELEIKKKELERLYKAQKIK